MENARKTKIVCTIGPSTWNREKILAMQAAGMDIARINLSHCTPQEFADLAGLIRGTDKAIPIILDLQGAEIRTGKMKKPVELKTGAKIEIALEQIEGNAKKICLKTPWIMKSLEKGTKLLIDDNSIEAEVIETGEGGVKCRILVGGRLSSYKTISIDQDSERPVLTENDVEAIRIALRKGVEFVALSFARTGNDVDELRKISGGMKIISKIEHKAALKDLDGIISKSDIVYIDRGDLGAEIPVEKIPFVQKIVIAKAKGMGKETFIATHLLESMTEKPKPTRAETTDVTNTILDGASGLVLAGETANGKFPVETVKMLKKLCENAELVEPMSDSGEIIKRLEALHYI
ncbi:MAG: pyruvate kinase [Candidatus Diapherotrites archaeon]|nr:pyruvate kinase [Candidatus Diapherotrites archaeon]